MVYNILKKTWRYIKCAVVLKQEIGIFKKKEFFYFGKNSSIMLPALQLSGCKNIKIGNNTTILNNCRLSVYGESEKLNILIGNNCYFGFGFSALSASNASIEIGDNVLFASNVLVTNENHGIDPELDIPYMDQMLSAKDVKIENGCWIGERVCILPGVHIGEKSIIGAGAVVTKSIPSYSIAVGNPAKVIKKYNFESKQWESSYGKNAKE